MTTPELAQRWGAADCVILTALERRKMTHAQIATATNMSHKYIQRRVSRLACAGRVEQCGSAKRPNGGNGRHPVLWRIKA